MISLPVPGIVQLVNNVMLSLIYIDIFLSDMWMTQIFYGKDKIDEDNEPLNSFFDENGYQSKILLKNIGSALVFLILYLAILIILVLLRLVGTFWEL